MTDNSCERETSQSPPAHNHSSFKTSPSERAGGGLLQAVARREARDQGGYHARNPQPAPGLRAHSRSLAGLAMPVAAQGKGPKKYAVTTDRALVVTKEVLVKQGYDVVRVENSGRDYVVWYRRGNKGRGKGKGPPVRMVIHRDMDRVVFLETPSAVLVDIEVRLKL